MKGQQTYREIYQQAQAFQAVEATWAEIEAAARQLAQDPVDEVIFTGCGTSLYLAQSAAYLLRKLGRMAATSLPCSELYHNRDSYILEGRSYLVLPITRKSITTEVRLAIDHVRKLPQVRSLAVTCDAGSASYNDAMLLSSGADEKSVVMTSSYSSMLYLIYCLASYLGARQPESIHGQARDFLKPCDDFCKAVLEEAPEANLLITLGQGVFYGVANESMNKIKEMGLANSEAYYSLEYRHGPMSLVDDKTVILLLASEAYRAEEQKLMAEMQSYGAKIAVLGQGVSKAFADYRCLDLPEELSEEAAAVLSSFAGQFLGYYLAERRGLDADRPRHLTQAIVLEPREG